MAVHALEVLHPPATKGHASVVRLARQWFIVATSEELKNKPVARTLQGVPLVLFRDGEGKAGALLDRCPHRNVPLSAGEVNAGELQCRYHGWRFDREGACRHIPSLVGESDGASPAEAGARSTQGARARHATSHATVEQDGFVWVCSSPRSEGEPASAPYRFTKAGAPGYTTVRQIVRAEGTMHATIENALDVPHTAFLHRGLFRSKSRGITIEAKVTRTNDRVVAEYVGEPRPPGVVAKLLSPSGGTVTHFDRFLLPSIAEVEYSIGTENHILVASAMTPVSDFVTKIFAVVSFRLRIPGALIKPFLKPLALRIFQQDAEILKMQTETIQRFGGEQFASTEIDVLGRHIWRLLKQAERGDPGGDEAHGESVQLVV
jgi:phenylpropionate dioxygenase-like ring-hydroxylating dioxygenase large terminal subunit